MDKYDGTLKMQIMSEFLSGIQIITWIPVWNADHDLNTKHLAAVLVLATQLPDNCGIQIPTIHKMIKIRVSRIFLPIKSRS